MECTKYGFIEAKQNKREDISRCCLIPNERIMVAELIDGYQSLSGQMINERYDIIYEENQNLLAVYDCDYALLIWKEQEEERMLFLSKDKRIRALEFVDYVISDFGLVRGNACCASGQISSAILAVQMAGNDLTDTLEYFMWIVQSYYHDCDWIDAEQYGLTHELTISEMPRYRKRKVAWAYVKSTEIAEEGKELIIKSLENESGLRVTAGPDVYIMIGCRGEVYDITYDKFMRTYEPTDEPLDAFEQMLDFFPEVITVEESEYITLDNIAHLCYPRTGFGIAAEPLQRRTKVFPKDKEQEYYLGRIGDYLAVRADDFCDIYVIQKDIFEQTYELDR